MPLACLQITMFPCGGIALGICLNHTIADVHTCSLFLYHWASVFSEDTSINLYAHDEAASMFPTNDAVLKNKSLRWQIPIDDLPRIVEMPDIVLQRFVFKASQISELKSRIKSTEQVPYPSRTVAIFALIWKISMKASSETTSPPKSAALVIVNLRPRFKTPLPDYSIGNIWWTAVSYCPPHFQQSYETTQNDDELQRVALQLQKSIEEVDAEFIENLKGEMGHKEVNKFLQGRGTGKGYLFTSIVRMGFNKVAFGWGNPIWVNFLGQSDILVPCGACLMEATGYGSNDNLVEAWVILPEKEMAIFQQDPQLLQYAVVNPKVI
ncbi:BAHD acyltransferase At5g47980 [Linum grandiflorum]